MTERFTDLNNHLLNVRRLNLSNDQKIHWVKHWFTEDKMIESKLWPKDSLSQTTTREMNLGHDWKIHLLVKHWSTKQENS